jgi:hypothetical protein
LCSRSLGVAAARAPAAQEYHAARLASPNGIAKLKDKLNLLPKVLSPPPSGDLEHDAAPAQQPEAERVHSARLYFPPSPDTSNQTTPRDVASAPRSVLEGTTEDEAEESSDDPQSARRGLRGKGGLQNPSSASSVNSLPGLARAAAAALASEPAPAPEREPQANQPADDSSPTKRASVSGGGGSSGGGSGRDLRSILSQYDMLDAGRGGRAQRGEALSLAATEAMTPRSVITESEAGADARRGRACCAVM